MSLKISSAIFELRKRTHFLLVSVTEMENNIFSLFQKHLPHEYYNSEQ